MSKHQKVLRARVLLIPLERTSPRVEASQRPGRSKRYARRRELGLLVLPCLFLVLEAYQLPLAGAYKAAPLVSSRSMFFSVGLLPSLQAILPLLVLLVAFGIVHLLLARFFPQTDQMLIPLVALLSGLGVLLAMRNGPDASIGADPLLGLKQLTWVLVGLGACLLPLFWLRSMDWLRRYKYTWAVLGLVLVGATLVHALHTNLNSPTHDQLSIGPLSFQPSEVLKILLVVFFAAYLSENQEVIAASSIRPGSITLLPLRQLGPLLLMLMIALALFLGIRELGLALLIYGSFLVLLYLGSGKRSYVLGGLVVFVALGFLGYELFGYIRERFATVGLDLVNWKQWSTATRTFAQNAGFQVAQGIVAISSGGILGAGFGLGHASALVPLAQSDMVVSVLAEEFGLAGMFAVLAVYLLLLARGFHLALEAREPFHQLLAAGLTSLFGIQTLVICGGALKLLPLTGLPLPFLSYGGSSVVANFLIIGLLLRLSHDTAIARGETA